MPLYEGPLKPRKRLKPRFSFPVPPPEPPEAGAWNKARQEVAEKLGIDLEHLMEQDEETRRKFAEAFSRLKEERGLIEPRSR